MPYSSLSVPATTPPLVRKLVWKLERHYLQPCHALFRLPIPNYRIEGEFAFGIAHLLLAVVAGVSTTLYEQSGQNGVRFRGVLEHYYPFDREPPTAAPPDESAKALWSIFRNSLAHDLGFDVQKRAKTPETKLARTKTRLHSGERGLTERMIAQLENTATRPSTKATVAIRADATVLSIDMLYWGTRCMVENLLNDPTRANKAQTFLASF